MADIFDEYSMSGAMFEAWDEMFERPGQPRSPYRSLFAALQPLAPADLRFRADQLARVFTDRGVTFAYAGEERPFPLDLISPIIDAVEWDLVGGAGPPAGGPGAVAGRRVRIGQRVRRRRGAAPDLVCSGNRVRMRTTQG